MRNILKIASFLDLLFYGLMFYVAEVATGTMPVPGSEHVNADLKAGESEAGKGASAKALGLAAAVEFTKADQRKRTVLVEAAARFANYDPTKPEGEKALTLECNEWLDGFAEGFANKDTARQRKRDARAVFEAYLIPAFEKVVGLEEVKGADGKPTKMPKKETRSGKDWITTAPTMGYMEFIAFCTEIRGKRGDGDRAPRLPKSFSADNAKTVANWMKVATPESASTVIGQALDGMATSLKTKPGAFEQMLVLEIEDACGRLAKSNDPHYAKLAQRLSIIITEEITERAKAEALARTGLTEKEIEQAAGIAPKPASAASAG